MHTRSAHTQCQVYITPFAVRMWCVFFSALMLTFTFAFMHLSDAFIQSDLHCIQVTGFFFFSLSALAFPGNRTHDLGVASAILYHLSYRNANGLDRSYCTRLWSGSAFQERCVGM